VQAPAVPLASVRVGGQLRPILAIGVDAFVIDLGDAAAQVGDRVVLFGSADRGEPTAEEWAAQADTNGDEIVTRVAARVPRVYVG
jgi:alanine racemase